MTHEIEIRQFISLMLERDAYERQTGQKFSEIDILQQFVSTSDIPRYYFTMTNLPKVGINPQSKYNTPIGVYTYPCTAEYIERLISNTLPFQTHAPYVSILEDVKPHNKLLVSKKREGAITSRDEFEELMAKAASLSGKKEHDLKNAELKNKHKNANFDGQLFGFTYGISKNLVKWATILRNLGFDSVYDSGSGIIHPSEPTQCVFLTPGSFKVIKMFETKTLRKPKKDPNETRATKNTYNLKTSPDKIKNASNIDQIQDVIFSNAWITPEILTAIKSNKQIVSQIIELGPIKWNTINPGISQSLVNFVTNKQFLVWAFTKSKITSTLDFEHNEIAKKVLENLPIEEVTEPMKHIKCQQDPVKYFEYAAHEKSGNVLITVFSSLSRMEKFDDYVTPEKFHEILSLPGRDNNSYYIAVAYGYTKNPELVRVGLTTDTPIVGKQKAGIYYMNTWGTWRKTHYHRLQSSDVAPIVNQFLAGHPKLNSKDVITFANIPGTDPAFFEKMLDPLKKSVTFYSAMAKRTDLSADAAQKLFNANDDRINKFLAKNPAYPDVLKQLAQGNSDEKIRQTAVKTLEKLRKAREKAPKSKK